MITEVGNLNQMLQNAGDNIPNPAALAAELRAMLVNNVNASPIFGAVKNILTNSISTFVFGRTAVISFTGTQRPSIYCNVGFGGAADLAMVYNYGSNIGKSAFYYDGKVAMRLDKIPGFAHHPAGHFLESTAAQFMAIHPECTVSVI